MANANKAAEEATYRAIGRFIFEFSQLEASLKYYIGEAVGLKEEHANIIISHDFSMLCSLGKDVLARSVDSGGVKIAKIISDCRRLNDHRIKVAHGLWVPFLNGGTVHNLSRQSLRTSMTADQGRELEKLASEANNVRSQLESYVWDVL